MKRIISMCLSAVLLLSLCVTGAAKTKTAQAEEKQKVIVIDAGHQIRAMSATEPIGPGSSQKGKGDRRSEWLCDTSAGI